MAQKSKLKDTLQQEIVSKWKKELAQSIFSSNKKELAYHLFDFDIGKLIIEPIGTKNLPPLFLAIDEHKVEMVKELLNIYNNKFKSSLVNSNQEINLNVLGKNKISPLQYAIYKNKKNIAKILLENGANVNYRTDLGNTSLIIAASEGNDDMVKFLLENKAAVDDKNNKENTALLLSFGEEIKAKESKNKKEQSKYEKVVNTLLGEGASISADNIDGNHVLQLAQKKHPQMAEHLLKHASQNDLEHADGKGRTSLHHALKGNDFSKFQDISRRVGNDVNVGDNEGNTVAHHAVQGANQDFLQEIKEHPNFDANVENAKGDTPALLAVKKIVNNKPGAKESLDILSKGPLRGNKTHKENLKKSLNRANQDGRTALSLAVHKHKDIGKHESRQLVDDLLKDGANPNVYISNKKGDTLVNYALGKGEDNIAQKLLNNGANINMDNKNGKSTLLELIQKHDVNGVGLCLKHGADVNKKWEGKPLLYYCVKQILDKDKTNALKFKDIQILEKLTDKPDINDSIDFQDNDGNTALHLAVKAEHKDRTYAPEVVDILTSKGANLDLENADKKKVHELGVPNRNQNLKSIVDYEKKSDEKEKDDTKSEGLFDSDTESSTSSKGAPYPCPKNTYRANCVRGPCCVYDNGDIHSYTDDSSYESDPYDYNSPNYPPATESSSYFDNPNQINKYSN